MANSNRSYLSSNTQRAYAGDLRHFQKLGGRIPCDVKAIANYLTACGDRFSVATLERRLVAIRQAHLDRGMRRLPTDDPEIKALMRGIRRRLGVAQRQAKPLSLKMLRQLVCAMDHSLSGLRDRALLLMGFAGAFRRSELVALNVSDLERTEEGLVVFIRRSKTDQEQRGRTVAIPATAGITCPVVAVE
jgi:site-specific recombinase XerD